ncbi:MAG: hypothetical protein AB1782_18860 [Cyanobacteriota bacterium]
MDYIIPTALVGLTLGLALYSLDSNGSILKFLKSSLNMKSGTNTQEVVVESLTTPSSAAAKAGSLGGTPDNPVSQCSYNNCTIDFGSYILTGIPKDFSDFVESSGNSGGTDALTSLLYQLADQLEAEGDTTGAQQFRDLANLGHYSAMIEQQVETLAESKCTALDSFCYEYIYSNQNPVNAPDNVSNLLTNITAVPLEVNMMHNRLDIAANYFFNNPTAFNTNKEIFSSFKMYEIYQDIMNKPGYSDSLKSITKEIVNQINNLKIEMDPLALCGVLMSPTSKVHDLDTGAQIRTISTSSNVGVRYLINPEYPEGTHLRSALICTTGNYDDKGQACH